MSYDDYLNENITSYPIETNIDANYILRVIDIIKQDIIDMRNESHSNDELKNMTKTSFDLIKKELSKYDIDKDRKRKRELSLIANDIMPIAMLIEYTIGDIMKRTTMRKKDDRHILGLLFRYKLIKRYYKCRCGELFCFRLSYPELYDIDQILKALFILYDI